MVRFEELARTALRAIRRRRDRRTSDIDAWHARAEQLGPRAVFDARHDADELDAVTADQRSHIFPALAAALVAPVRVAVDLGCGSGRFTPTLAEHASELVIGLDPIDRLLRMAPSHDRVAYARMGPGALPLRTKSVDLLFASVVLGTMDDDGLRRTVAEVDRVLRPDGTLFLVENTSDGPRTSRYRTRSTETYQRVFAFAQPVPVSEFQDIDETITCLAGRQRR